mmetsp:Transcript_135951/g.378904  ORF Transcript_135951/g.378904 Transcript_135951/m.378904 type:complete len:319 (+) Transcript_135951:613-1569(+)
MPAMLRAVANKVVQLPDATRNALVILGPGALEHVLPDAEDPHVAATAESVPRLIMVLNHERLDTCHSDTRVGNGPGMEEGPSIPSLIPDQLEVELDPSVPPLPTRCGDTVRVLVILNCGARPTFVIPILFARLSTQEGIGRKLRVVLVARVQLHSLRAVADAPLRIRPCAITRARLLVRVAVAMLVVTGQARRPRRLASRPPVAPALHPAAFAAVQVVVLGPCVIESNETGLDHVELVTPFLTVARVRPRARLWHGLHVCGKNHALVIGGLVGDLHVHVGGERWTFRVDGLGGPLVAIEIVTDSCIRRGRPECGRLSR